MWNKDRLAVVLLLASFALMGAECTLIHQETVDEKRLPDRADISANGLVRTYYDTATTPSKMTAIKIPEGTGFDENELTVNFEMGGGATVVTEVRARLNIQPPKGTDASKVDLQARIIRPDGLASPWSDLSLVDGSVLRSQIDFFYINELDGGSTSGLWKIQLRDNVADKDGRCLFRNATLILNNGGVVGTGGTAEVATVTPATGNFGSVMDEVIGGRSSQDWGHVGIERMLVNQFTLTNAGICTGVTLSFSLKYGDADNPTDSVQVLVIAPDGAWDVYTPDFAGGSVYSGTGFFNISTASFGSNNGNTNMGPYFEFLGAPTSGVWTVAMWDSVDDGARFEASPDATDGAAILPATDWTLTVTRQ